MYASLLKLGPALILGKNLYFETLLRKATVSYMKIQGLKMQFDVAAALSLFEHQAPTDLGC